MLRKTLKCSTWNKLISFFFSVLLCFSLLGCVLSSVSFAGAVAVPVGAELIGELLVALGLMAGNSTDGYTWINRDNPYVETIFEKQIGNITSGVPISSETLGQLSGSVIPDDIYSYDGTTFYSGSKPVTTSDLFLTAKSLVGSSYSMPVNIAGAQFDLGLFSSSVGNSKYGICLAPSDWGADNWYFPYIRNSQGDWVLSPAFSLTDFNTSPKIVTTFDLKTSEINKQSQVSDYFQYVYYPVFINTQDYYTRKNVVNTGLLGDGNSDNSLLCFTSGNVRAISVQGVSESYVWENDCQHSLLFTRGVPTFELSGDSHSLGDSIVQVKPSNNDDNNGSTPPVPQSPNNWEIWQTVTDLIKQIDSGEITNGGTDYQQYVNNNYNYVDVDINVPDTIHNDVNISGGLDVTGSGSVDITIHEDISLPSVGDGSGFYNPDATDVIGALGKDNPVTDVVSGLFSSIDPALLGVFSVSVSLLFVLGLWKLIRG